jgi:RimJ/RimL family protein N-acetyltransferase
MEQLPKDERQVARPLYEGFPGLHGAIDSALEGVLGNVFADDRSRPRVARIVIGDFHAISGDPSAPAAAEALLAVPHRDYIAVHDSWHELVRRTLPVAQAYDRFAFQAPPRWDRRRLATFRASLPEDYTLQRVDAGTVAAFRALNETFVDNFESMEDFLRRGVGFAVTIGGEMVAGCSSYSISSNKLEFEIETRPDYWRRGLALVTGSRLIDHCLDNVLEPCWDAAHEGSARLAEALGFVGRRHYTSYRLARPEMPESQFSHI